MYVYVFLGTKFGAILDQLTDRCGTMSLCIALSNFYPKYMFLFQLSCVIDIACHWIYLHSYVKIHMELKAYIFMDIIKLICF